MNIKCFVKEKIVHTASCLWIKFNSIGVIISFLFLYFLFSACNLNTVYENRIEDKREGEILVDSFYNYLTKEEYDRTYSMYSKEAYQKMDKANLLSLYKKVSLECGVISTINLVEWKTNIIKGGNPRSEYMYVYMVNRKNCSTKETIILKKYDGKIKIFSYNVIILLAQE